MISAQDFIDRAEEMNIGHTTYSPHGMAGGVSIFDFDNDGWQDIYFTGGKYQDHLYRNLGDGSFEDVSTEMGLDLIADRYTMGVVAGDLDNDGFRDLFITTFKEERNICLRNNSGMGFEDIAESAGFSGTNWTSSTALGDIDLDGDLDVFVSNYVDFDAEPFFFNVTNSKPNILYENLGNWTFVVNKNIFENGHDGCTLAAAFTDVNRDMNPDLFVINDFGDFFGTNELYMYTYGFLSEMSDTMGAAAAMNGMGIAIGDFDDDGFFDYYLTNIRDNILYRNNAGQSLQEVSHDYKVNDNNPYYAWGTFFADLNNDTNLDLFVAKGSISESEDFQENKLYEYYPLFDNFADVSNLKGLNHPGKARGAVVADLDKDGRLDIVTNNVRVTEQNNDRPSIFMNQGSAGDFLILRLEGNISNRDAFGTRVEVFTSGKRMIRELTGGSTYLSNHHYMLHFGLGDLEIDSMHVYWPSGDFQTFSEIQRNASYFLEEGANLVLESGGSSSVVTIPDNEDLQLSPNPASTSTKLTSKELTVDGEDLTIFDQSGRQVAFTYKQTGRHEVEIRTEGFHAGLYFLRIKVGAVEYTSKLLVK